jgi:hypothetical protein
LGGFLATEMEIIMDDLVMKKLERLHFVLLRIEAQEQLEKLIERLDNEIAAEHGVQRIDDTHRHFSVYSPETALIILACS